MNRRKGSSTIEFTLVGIPLIFTLISIFEISRGMWIYHTMAYAIKEGTRYGVVHGNGCTTPGNSCQVTIGQIAQHIKDAGIGLEQDELTLTFRSLSNGTHSCPNKSTLTDCLSDTTTWPAAPDNLAGFPIQIDGKIKFSSAIAMFWPGSTKGINFTTVYFPSTSREVVQF